MNMPKSIEDKIAQYEQLSDERNALDARVAVLQEDIAKDLKALGENKYFRFYVLGEILNLGVTCSLIAGAIYWGYQGQWLGFSLLMALTYAQTYISPWSSDSGPFTAFKINILLKSGMFDLRHYYRYNALFSDKISTYTSLKESM